jgi:hypothetical protein
MELDSNLRVSLFFLKAWILGEEVSKDTCPLDKKTGVVKWVMCAACCWRLPISGHHKPPLIVENICGKAFTRDTD